MSLPDVNRYKPDAKWGLTDDEFDCAMYRFLRQQIYVRTLNAYVVQRVKARVLEAIIPPVITSKRRGRKGRWIHKPGLSMTNSRPDYFRSLANYGDLFFETAMGSHKEFEDEKGRGIGMAGQFVIFWECDMVMKRGKHPKCGNVDSMQFFNSLATAYALIEEAHSRGDHVTFMMEPGSHDATVPKYMSDAERRAPVIGMKFQLPPGREMSRAWAREKENEAGYSTDKMTQKRVNVTRGEMEVEDIFRTEMTIGGGVWTYPGEHAPMGPLLNSWTRNRTALAVLKSETHRPDEPPDNYTALLSGHFFWRDSEEYDEMLDELLNIWYPNDSDGRGGANRLDWAWPLYGIAAVENIMRSVPTHDKRGTFIFLTGVQNMDWTWQAFNYLRALHRKFDIYVMDVGEHDWQQTFLREPTFLLKGAPYIKYINISHLVRITVSQLGFNNFSTLHITVMRDHLTATSHNTIVEIWYNGSFKRRRYSSVDFPTVASLVKAIQTDYPELKVERVTVPRYPTVELTEKDVSMNFADGALILSGYDVENFTYKLLKAIGGKVNGVAVV
jgi:hypothetical protein